MIRIQTNLGMSLIVGLALCFSSVADAQEGIDPNWGTKASTFNLNCTSGNCSGGGVSGGDSGSGITDDNIQGNPASSTISNSLGTTNVTTNFIAAAPGLSNILFTGDSVSTTLGISTGTGKALGLYTYSGPGVSLTITMTIAPNATFAGPLSGATNSIDGISGTVFLFTDPGAIDDINAFELGADLSCLFECYSPDEDFNVEIDDGVNVPTNSVTISLADGDQFYVYGQMNIGSAGAGTADAGDGIEVSFSPTAGLTSIPGGSAPIDTDGDGVSDDEDNCTLISNADQRDTNGDGYGNICDPDLNNDGIVNFVDIGLWAPFFNTANTGDEDFDGDGIANFIDFSIIPDFFLGLPGPSGVAP